MDSHGSITLQSNYAICSLNTVPNPNSRQK